MLNEERIIRVKVKGIYDVNHNQVIDDDLPPHLAILEKVAGEEFLKAKENWEKQGNTFPPISDMFRSYEMQAELYKVKPNLAKPPGHSYHEAGLAFDFKSDFWGASQTLIDFYNHLVNYGWYPLQKIIYMLKADIMPSMILQTSECWHIQRTKDIGYYESKFTIIQEAIAWIGNDK